MIEIRKVASKEKRVINEIVSIHLDTFIGFFLTFMGRGFLNQMYRSYCEHDSSGVLIAEEDGEILGFLAYSSDFSGLYKFMIRKKLVWFGCYSLGALLRKPASFFHLLTVFLKPSEVKRKEKYVELASIGVTPKRKYRGIGTVLIDELKKNVDFNEYAYISLETDAVNNEAAIRFYTKNGFIKEREYVTDMGRRMYEFRYK